MIDLHVHSTASDGTHSPSEIINMAKEIGITTIALTDHDTIDGLEEADNEAKKLNVDFIPGIELKADYINELHILGYFIDYKNENLKKFLDKQVEARINRNKKYVEKFTELGIDITYDEVIKVAGKDGVILKPHFVTLLYNKGYIKDLKEAYTKYFNTEEFKRISLDKPSPKEVIEVIIKAGGIPVLAHPILTKQNDDEVRRLIKELMSYGLMGLEVYHSDQSPEDSIKYMSWANEFNLIATAGTDYHGEEVKPGLKLGTGFDNKNIVLDTSIVCELKDKFDEINHSEKFNKRINARCIIIHDNKVLAIRRVGVRNGGETYYTTPGGGREGNETIRNNLLREAKEEIDQNVKIKNMFATMEDAEGYQHFYEVELENYNDIHLGSGDGTEFIDPSRGTYDLEWIDLKELSKYPFYPLEIRDKIIEKFLNNKKINDYYIIKM